MVWSVPQAPENILLFVRENTEPGAIVGKNVHGSI